MSETSTAAATLVLTAELRAEIERHAERAYPDECCGVMLGRQEEGDRRVVESLIEIENEWDEAERRRRFLITPQQVMRAEKQAREQGLDILGYYHSHPDAEPRPSEFDREHAWPWYSYPIVGVQKGKAVEVRVWQLLDDRSGYVEAALLND
jgi:proteasome lid subunit RPN8/RPN11